MKSTIIYYPNDTSDDPDLPTIDLWWDVDKMLEDYMSQTGVSAEYMRPLLNYLVDQDLIRESVFWSLRNSQYAPILSEGLRYFLGLGYIGAQITGYAKPVTILSSRNYTELTDVTDAGYIAGYNGGSGPAINRGNGSAIDFTGVTDTSVFVTNTIGASETRGLRPDVAFGSYQNGITLGGTAPNRLGDTTHLKYLRRFEATVKTVQMTPTEPWVPTIQTTKCWRLSTTAGRVAYFQSGIKMTLSSQVALHPSMINGSKP